MILCVCPNPSIDKIAVVNQLIPGAVNRILEQNEFAGGKGIHVAFGLRELKEECRLLGFWGGISGNWLKERCAEAGIECFGPIVHQENRRCYTLINPKKDSDINNTELLEPGPFILEAEFEKFIVEFEKKCLESDFICMSGSWPAGAPENAYYQLIRASKTKGKRVLLDTSGKQLENALQASPFGLHINLEEAKTVFQHGNLKIILQYFSRFTELTALTCGEKGLFLVYKGQAVHANVNINPEYSSVGSGDCLTAGIAWALYQRMSPVEMARWGVACGAANCLRKELGMFYKRSVEQLFNRVVIKQISL
ncbi:MAG: 1-phosphofructokinase family hexose kinase [Ginsengibacter sp.]